MQTWSLPVILRTSSIVINFIVTDDSELFDQIIASILGNFCHRQTIIILSPVKFSSVLNLETVFNSCNVKANGISKSFGVIMQT